MSPSRSGSSPAQRISVRTASSASARDGRRFGAADLPRPVLLFTGLSMNSFSGRTLAKLKATRELVLDDSSFLQPPQCHFLDPVAFAFLENEIGARAGRQNIFVQVDEIDAIPDVGGGFDRFAIR